MSTITASAPNLTTGYKSFDLGRFSFRRDEYFMTMSYPEREPPIVGYHADRCISGRLCTRCGMEFFYDWVNFDNVLGTCNKYDSVELYAGRYNNSCHNAGLDYTERFKTPQILETFKAMLVD